MDGATWRRLRWLCGELPDLTELIDVSRADSIFQLGSWRGWLASSAPLEHALPGRWDVVAPAARYIVYISHFATVFVFLI